MTLPEPQRSRGWSVYLRAQYRLIRLMDPLIRTVWRGYGLGNVVELGLVGRRTGRPRRVLVGLLRADGDWFVGHPNGPCPWTLNLEAAGGATLTPSWPTTLSVRARRLAPGAERDRAILATSQHVFPGNVVYRLARAHVRAVGAYYALEVVDDEARTMPRVDVAP
ncbi:MAG: hypothetical protein ACHQ3P_03925 [Candidatus Limnocylindrales bacterium]